MDDLHFFPWLDLFYFKTVCIYIFRIFFVVRRFIDYISMYLDLHCFKNCLFIEL